MAVKCSRCQADNPETVKFCGECGTRLDVSGETPRSDAPPSGAEKPPSPRDLAASGSKDQASVTRTIEISTDELKRGTLIAGRYEIIEELGAGGMGRVYRGYDKKIEEEVALKVIRPEIAAEMRTVERFRNEIKTARKISHKNVCRMFDLQEEGRTLFITMEYVRGEDLKSVIRRMGTLTMGKAVSIARQVAEGLGEAHRLGVVHRDLKPGNIMIDKEANINLGTVYSSIEDWEKALERNETLIRNGVHTTFPYGNSILLCYLPMGMYDKALDLIERAPESIRKIVLRNVPWIYLNMGDYGRALEDEKKLALTNPPDYWLRGHAYFLLDDFNQAEENYRKLVESEDLSTRAAGHYLLHFIYKAQGKYDRAEKEAARVIEIAEEARQPHWKDWTLWALITMDINTGDLIKAKEIVDKEIRRLEEEKSPPDFDWIYYKTWIAARMKSFEEAKKALGELKVLTDKAVSLFPVPTVHKMPGMGAFALSFIDYADYIDPLARAYLESGDLKKARFGISQMNGQALKP